MRGSVVLFQFYGPIGVVEELLPAVVALMAEVDMDEWIVLWPDRLLDKRHTCQLGGSAALFHVAFRAGTNNIFPD